MPTEELLDLHLAFRALSDEDGDDMEKSMGDASIDDDELKDDDMDGDDDDEDEADDDGDGTAEE